MTGDAIPTKPNDRDDFFRIIRGADVPQDFLDTKQRGQGSHDRDPFEGWSETAGYSHPSIC